MQAQILKLKAGGDGILKRSAGSFGIGTSVLPRIFKQTVLEPANLR